MPQHTDASDDSPFLCQQDSQPSATWGLTQEARYFAELDTELLVEDEQDLSQSQSQAQREQEQKQAAAEQDDTMCATSNQAKQLQVHASASDSHQPMQTPGALALIKYHPDLQVFLRISAIRDNTLTPLQAVTMLSECNQSTTMQTSSSA